MKHKIVVAHPGQQHSYKVATGLKKAGLLEKYITAIYDKKSIVMRIAHHLVKGKDRDKIVNRTCPALDDNEVELHFTFLSLCVIVLSRNTKTRRFALWLDRKIADFFGLIVAIKAIRLNATAVLCFSMNERICFKYIKKRRPDILCICDCANSPVDYMRHIYEDDMEKFNHTVLKNEVPEFWNRRELKKQAEGIAYTDYFLAPSTFVKKGLQWCGVNEKKIMLVPYGSNFEIGACKELHKGKSVRFVYVGQVSYRKGVHHLLGAFSKLREDGAYLDIVGAIGSDNRFKEQYSSYKNINFVGSVPHEMVKEYLLAADVFVFPSLTEGFSLACLEAISCGLPLICTYNSGANDTITHGVDGFVYEAFDEVQLKKYMEYFLKYPEKIEDFSKEIIKKAEKYTWDQYNQRMLEAINTILIDSGE